MASTLPDFCSTEDVYSILSQQGVNWAIDDDSNGITTPNEPQWLVDCKERAKIKITQYLARMYDLTTLAGNTWIKWAAATLTAVELMRRRGENAPDGLVVQANEFLDFLKMVMNGDVLIPQDGTDDARLTNQNAGLCMTNLHFDQRFGIAKIRSIQNLSSGPANSKLPRQPDYVSTQFNN